MGCKAAAWVTSRRDYIRPAQPQCLLVSLAAQLADFVLWARCFLDAGLPYEIRRTPNLRNLLFHHVLKDHPPQMYMSHMCDPLSFWS